MIPQGGFNKTVSLSCQGLPANIACSFEPSAVQVMQSKVDTIMKVSSGSTVASTPAGASGMALGLALPWSLTGMAVIAAKGKKRTIGALQMILLVTLAAGAMAISGCGVTSNTAQTYHVTLAAQAEGSTVQTSTFDVVLRQQPAPF
jgi:hypothetical protein